MLRYIYVLFVGIFVAIFLGLGIEFFYESPKPPEEPAWFGYQYSDKYGLTESQRAEEREYNKKMDIFNDTTMSDYNRDVSIIALCGAVVILVLSLVLGSRLSIIADVLLLGGIFTLLYAVIRGVSVQDNRYRFILISGCLVTTIILGYFKFVPKKAAN